MATESTRLPWRHPGRIRRKAGEFLQQRCAECDDRASVREEPHQGDVRAWLGRLTPDRLQERHQVESGLDLERVRTATDPQRQGRRTRSFEGCAPRLPGFEQRLQVLE